MNLIALVLVLLAPVPYWVLGLAWFSGGDGSRARLAPLAGCALAGLYAEFALVVGLPARVCVGALTIASAGVVLLRARRLRDPVERALLEWLPYYWVAVLAASLSPFPILGNWEGDWHLLYQMGQSVLGGSLPIDMLARPPLFGAAATPLWIFGSGGLTAYQVMAAVASAAAVTATLSLVDHFWPKAPRIILLPLLLSPFFLHHTAAAWAKLLAGGLILAAVVEGLGARRWASSALFALAVAVHEGSILWAPCVLLAHAAGPAGARGAVRAIGPMVAMGLLVVAPLQIWILLKYGLAAKIGASPVLTDRDKTPFLLKSLHAIVSAFVGWGPSLAVARWLGHPHPTSLSVVSKEGYWLVTSWITTLSGTLAGLLFPFLFVRRALSASPARVRELLGPWTIAAIGFAVVMNGVLPGFSSNEGTMQNALVPLALGLYALLVGRLVVPEPGRPVAIRTMAWLMGLLGTLPWLLANLGTSMGLWASRAFRERLRTGSEGDYFRVIDNHLEALGMAAFPEGALLCIALLAAWAWFHHRRSGGFGASGKDSGAKSPQAGDGKRAEVELMDERARENSIA